MPCSPTGTSQSPLQTTEPPEQSDRAPHHMIDHKFYPMIMDAILDYAPHSVLVAFRRTSREYLERADARIFKHIVLGARPIKRAADGSYEWVAEGGRSEVNVTTPWGDNLPAIRRICYHKWLLGNTPDDEKGLEKRYLELYRHTRIIDIDDADGDCLDWFTDNVVQPPGTTSGYHDRDHNRVKVVRFFPTFPYSVETLGDTAIIFPRRWPLPVNRDTSSWPWRDKRTVPPYTSRAVHIIRVQPDYRSLLDYGNYGQDPKHSLREETFIFTHARPLDADMTRFRGHEDKIKNKARWDGFVGDLARRLVRCPSPNFDPITCIMVDFEVLQPDWFGLDIAHTDMEQCLMDDIANVLRVGVDMGERAEDHLQSCAWERRHLAQRIRAHEIAEGYLGYPPAQGPQADDTNAD